jgi:hypothetical protein
MYLAAARITTIGSRSLEPERRRVQRFMPFSFSTTFCVASLLLACGDDCPNSIGVAGRNRCWGIISRVLLIGDVHYPLQPIFDAMAYGQVELDRRYAATILETIVTVV